MKCYICGSEIFKNRDGKVRDNPALEILECCECGLVFLSNISHITTEFYEESNMHQDFNFLKWRKNTNSDDSRRLKFIEQSVVNKNILDFGSGNGGFLLGAKKIAKSVTGLELDKAVQPYYKDDNIPLFDDIQKLKEQKYDIVTLFHVIEHLSDPIQMLEEIKSIVDEDGKIIIEVPNANDVLLTVYKNEPFSKFTYWSCHLFLYTHYTLIKLAQKAGLEVDFVKHIQRYPLSNHLYWLSRGEPGGHVQWGNFIDSNQLSQAYESQLASLGMTDTLIAQFRKV